MGLDGALVTVETRIAALEREMAALRGHQDQIAQNALAFGPKGEVILEALGLQLQEGTVFDADASTIRWVRGGKQAEVISAYDGAGVPTLHLRSNDPAHTGEFADLNLFGDPENPQIQVTASGTSPLNRHNAKILDSEGNSDFLQLAEEGNVHLDFGIDVVEWPGGTGQSDTATVTGIKGKTNALYFTQPILSDTEFFLQVANPTIHQFDVIAFDPSAEPPAGHQQSFYWAALTE
jgi:hypothetical protein